MGNYVGTAAESGPESGSNTTVSKSGTHNLRKRLGGQVDDDFEEVLHTPKRKQLKSTSKYIFTTLFVNGENSDIAINALGKTWNLHKLYLCQSRYFSCMFNGSWKESKLTEVDMDIPDANIDIEALDVCLGSLYQDEVVIDPSKVESVLAAASLLQLDGLIQQCADIMTDTICLSTVCSYHTSSSTYGIQHTLLSCFEWLERNLMMTTTNISLLKEISVDLMKSLINSSNLFVLQVEMDIYSLIKKYVYLKSMPQWTGDPKQLAKDADSYFRSLKEPGEFLNSETGKIYEDLFKGVRLHHIINDLSSTRLIDRDKIIPPSWILPVYKQQWQNMLCVEQGQDKGPSESELMPEHFKKYAMRCGRIISKEGEYCWRWTGFNYGVDLLVTFCKRQVIFKRNTNTHPVSNSVSLQPNRKVMFQVSVTSYNSQGHSKYTKSSGLQYLDLKKDEEVVVLEMDSVAEYPIQISVYYLCYSLPMDLLQLDSVENISEQAIGEQLEWNT
ncbi:germ cell-less protein-like 1 [Anneissia japonica]|uniref:germ cell-less protein-like 1 n=1 Tax=Anneissia japonica TaxID=1529436 RepID=UPI0014259251|nr:germ cell-less protein-like 1 [Anneissia japonica]